MTHVLTHTRKNRGCGSATYAWVECSVYTFATQSACSCDCHPTVYLRVLTQPPTGSTCLIERCARRAPSAIAPVFPCSCPRARCSELKLTILLHAASLHHLQPAVRPSRQASAPAFPPSPRRTWVVCHRMLQIVVCCRVRCHPSQRDPSPSCCVGGPIRCTSRFQIAASPPGTLLTKSCYYSSTIAQSIQPPFLHCSSIKSYRPRTSVSTVRPNRRDWSKAVRTTASEWYHSLHVLTLS